MMRHGQEKKNNDKVYHGGQTVSFFFPINMQFFSEFSEFSRFELTIARSANLTTLGLWQ